MFNVYRKLKVEDDSEEDVEEINNYGDISF